MSAARNLVQTTTGVSIENGMETSKTDGAGAVVVPFSKLTAVLMGCAAEAEGIKVGLQLFD